MIPYPVKKRPFKSHVLPRLFALQPFVAVDLIQLTAEKCIQVRALKGVGLEVLRTFWGWRIRLQFHVRGLSFSWSILRL